MARLILQGVPFPVEACLAKRESEPNECERPVYVDAAPWEMKGNDYWKASAQCPNPDSIETHEQQQTT